MLENIIMIVATILSGLALLGGLITVWVNTNVKIARIETTVNLKIASLEMALAGNIKSNNESLSVFIAENKDEHKNISADVKEIRGTLVSIELQMAKLAK